MGTYRRRDRYLGLAGLKVEGMGGFVRERGVRHPYEKFCCFPHPRLAVGGLLARAPNPNFTSPTAIGTCAHFATLMFRTGRAGAAIA